MTKIGRSPGLPAALTLTAACSLLFFLERARGLRRRRVHVRRSHGHVLDRALQQLGHRSIPHPKNLGRIRPQSQNLRVHAKDVQRRSTSVVGLVAGSSSEGLGHAAGQLQRSTAKSTVAQEIGLRTSASREPAPHLLPVQWNEKAASSMSASSIRRPHFGFESSLIGRQTVHEPFSVPACVSPHPA